MIIAQINLEENCIYMCKKCLILVNGWKIIKGFDWLNLMEITTRKATVEALNYY